MQNIFVYLINSPGATITELIHRMAEQVPSVAKLLEEAAKLTPLRRNGEPIDIAKGVVFLSSSDASFITGANLVIDGGLVFNLAAMPY